MNRTRTLNVAFASSFAALTAIGGMISVPLPFSPVPISLQTLFVYLSGAVLGGYIGALSQAIYILLGCVGLPVFSGPVKAGFQALLGPTGGYLIGFVAGAFILGKLVESRRKLDLRWMLTSMVLCTFVIYGLGVFQLSLWLGVGLEKAAAIGVLPFLIGDSVKIVLASFISIRVRRLLLYRIK